MWSFFIEVKIPFDCFPSAFLMASEQQLPVPWLFVTTALSIIYLKLLLLLVPVSSGKCIKFQKHLEVWFLNKSVRGVGGVLTSCFL